jgi:hypothetical protein
VLRYAHYSSFFPLILIEITMVALLDYPIELEPQIGDGSAIEIAPGVLWLRMPLFASLPWINVWAIAEEAGWTIVDTGLHSLKTIDAWQAALAGPLGGAPVLRVVVTHMHPDHCGMAGWIAERFNAPLCMSRLEYLTCRLMAADTGRKAPEEGIAFYRAAGWDATALEGYKGKFGSFGQMIYPLPASYRVSRMATLCGSVLTNGPWKSAMGILPSTRVCIVPS